MRRLSWLILFTCSAVAGAKESAPVDAVAEFRAATGVALQADLKSALPHLARIRAEDLSGEKLTTFLCMRDRFVGHKPVKDDDAIDPSTAKVLAAYRGYWTRVMLGSTSAAEAEPVLASTLAKLLGESTGSPAMDALEPILQRKLEAHGYHALFGVTAPLREFMLWRKQSDETYDIDLPGGREAVHVTMMDDFVSYGWLGYATCDYYHSAGWAKPDRLFAVRSAYDLDSEEFRVSYLAHEGQHFADYRRFPALAQPELEYRAKLVEVATAKTTLYDLLAGFTANGGDSREAPHPWADRQVVTRLAAKVLGGKPPSAEAWKAVSIEQLNAAAHELLEQDNRDREAEIGATR